jgi:hypothetical protein
VKPLRIAIIDVLDVSPVIDRFRKPILANLAPVMPQAIAVWCEEEGHEVHMDFCSGHKFMFDCLDDTYDVVIIASATWSSVIAYALGNYYRSKGAITILGGPHARAYPEHAVQYFDYVFGLTDKDVFVDVLQTLDRHRPIGKFISARAQPKALPSVRQRWKYVSRLMDASPWVRSVMMSGSLGCPYTCSFCVDATVPYQTMDFDQIRDDLTFVSDNVRNPITLWADPNFGVRFNDYLTLIEETIPAGNMRFAAESSLTLLTEANVKRLQKNGFMVMMPGIESWYDFGAKSKTRKIPAQEKLDIVADQISMIGDHIPFIQANLIMGMDSDAGAEPFDLTKEFLRRTPGIFPSVSMLISYGRSAPDNLRYQSENRVIPLPFHAMDASTTNVRPKNYGLEEYYQHWIDMYEDVHSWSAIRKRVQKGRGLEIKGIMAARSIFESRAMLAHLKKVQRYLREDRGFRAFFEQDTDVLPSVYLESAKHYLGPLLEWLPEGALTHDPYAHSKELKLA